MIDPKELNEMQLRTDRVALMRKESFFEHSENDIRHVIIKFINDNDRLIAEVKTLNAALDVMNDDGRQNEIRLVNRNKDFGEALDTIVRNIAFDDICCERCESNLIIAKKALGE